MIKSIKKNDIRTTPFTAAKTWNPQNKVHKDLILWQSGSTSGSLSLVFKEFNDGTVPPYTYISSALCLQQQEDDFIRFREGVNLTGSMSPTGSFYYDPILSEKNIDGTYKTVLYTTTKHLFYKESQDPTKIFGLESLDSSKVNRNLPNKISTFNIPQNKFGEKVIPNTVEITHEIQGKTYSVVDDGNSNLVINDKTFVNDQDVNINKIAAKIVLSDLTNEVYDGDPYVVSAITKPSNLSYVITYNGSTIAPTDAGTYTVVATINDNFYFGSVTGTFIIEKAPRSITLSNLTQTYDGKPKTITATTAGLNLNKIITYNGSLTPPTDAGIYEVSVIIDELNYKGSTRGSLVIIGQSHTISAPSLTKTYGDDEFIIPLNTKSTGRVSYTITSGPGTINNINGKIKITNIGTINVTINQAASINYSAASTTCTITVNQKPLTVVGITAYNKVHDGNSTATLNTTNKELVGVVTYVNGTTDDVTLTGIATGNFSDSSVGEGKTVTISGLSITGGASGKYILIQPTTIASIKVSSASGTITMNSATVTYNGNPQSLNVSISDSNIPIKITYKDKNGNTLRVDELFKNQLIKSSGNDYPKDSSLYEVIAELNTEIKTPIKYTVSTTTATLKIIPIQASISFGSNVFNYDGSPKQIQILSKTPANFNPLITYIGLSLLPIDVGTYNVLIESFDQNIFYKNTIQLKIISAATNKNCGDLIFNQNQNQQNQKYLINLSSNVYKPVFIFNVKKGASQFILEYPPGNEIYDSGLRSPDAIGTNLIDYVTQKTVTIGGIANGNFTIDKDKTGTINGVDTDKCLLTVYSPTNSQNDWNCSVSCINNPPAIPDLENFTFDKTYTFPSDSTWLLQERSIVDLINKSTLLSDLTVNYYYGNEKNKITLFEAGAISGIINNNIENDTKAQVGKLTSFILYNDVSNIKIIVSGIKNQNGSVTVGLKYQRVTDSLLNKIDSAPFVVIDCHLYEYTQNEGTFDLDKAKQVLKEQIYSDIFKNTFISVNSDNTDGETQRRFLISIVNGLEATNYYGNYVISDRYDSPQFNLKLQQTTETTDIAGILSSVFVYVKVENKQIVIVYPSICQTFNLRY